jgi:hypothetical protein
MTGRPFTYSVVGYNAPPAGPVPLTPNRLWSRAESVLLPQPDSTMACAIVTAAGTPYLRWAAIAPGAICSMNVRSAPVCAAAAGAAGTEKCGRVGGLAAG